MKSKILFFVLTFLYASFAYGQDETNIANVAGEAATIKGGDVNVPIFGFSLQRESGDPDITDIVIRFSTSPTGIFIPTSFDVYTSTDQVAGDGDDAFQGTMVLSSGNDYIYTFASYDVPDAAQVVYIYADIDPNITTAASISASFLSATGSGTINGSATSPTYNNTNITPLATALSAGAGAATTAQGDQGNVKILSVAALSNGSQTLQKLVFEFDSDVVNTFIKPSTFSLKIGGTAVSGAGYAYDGTTRKLTVTSINTAVNSSVTFDLHADLDPEALGPFTVFVNNGNNPADNTATNVNQGYLTTFTTVTNTVTVSALEADFTDAGGSAATAIGSDTGVKLLSFTAESNGTQSLSQVVIDFDTDIDAILDDGSFELKVGGSTVGTALYDGTSKVTVSGIATAINSGAPVQFDLFADVLPNAAAGNITITLDDANNPADNSASTVNRGYVNAFADIANTVAISALEADFTDAGGAATTATGSQADVLILSFNGESNGTQSLEQLVFDFDADVDGILDASAFALKVGGTTVGTAVYDGSEKLTVSSISEAINNGAPVQFDLYATVLGDAAASSFTVALDDADNAADNSDGTVDQGFVAAFTDIANTVTVSALEVTFTDNGSAETTAIGSQSQVKILSIDAASNGVQSLEKLIIDFDTDISAILDDATFVLKNGSTTVGSASYASQQVTITGIGEDVTSAITLDLYVDVLADAAAGSFTVSLSNTSNPEDNSENTVDQGYVATFTDISNTVTISQLEADFTTAAGAETAAIGNTGDVKIFSFTAESNGTQTLESIVLAFTAGADATFDAAAFELKDGGTTVGTAVYDGNTDLLTISTIATAINDGAPVQFDLFADVLASAPAGSVTVTLDDANNPADNSGNTVDQGYVSAFADVANTVTITPLQADFTAVAGAATDAIGSNEDVLLLSFEGESNGTQSLETLVFDFTAGADASLNAATFELKVGAVTVGTAVYDGNTDKLTVSSIATAINTGAAVQFDLYGDVLPSAPAGSVTVTLDDASNPANNGAGTVDQGYVKAFTDFDNTLTIEALEADFTSVGGAATSAVGGTANVKILSLSAVSNGDQDVEKLIFDFNIDITGTLNTATFALKNGSTTVGTAAYVAGTKKLTISAINQDISAAQQLDLYANVLASSAATSFTVSLSSGSNPADNSLGTVDQGLVASGFTTVSNNFSVTLLEADFTAVAGATNATTAGNSDVKILSLQAESNGTQTLQKLVFSFDTDITPVLNTTSFALKNGPTTVGTASYNSGKLTVSTIAAAINTGAPVQLDLYVNVLAAATASSFTVSLNDTDNPANNSITTVNQGFVKAFTDFGNTVTVTALEADFTEVAGAASAAIGADTDVKILSFEGESNGNQTVTELTFAFDVDITGVLDDATFALKDGGSTVGTATYDALTKKLNVTGINTAINSGSPVQFDLFADVLHNAPAGSFTVSLLPADHPADNSANTVNQGSVAAFAAFDNSVTVTSLAANFTAVGGSSTGAVGGTQDVKILSLSALSNGPQTLEKLIFDFNVDVAAVLTNFELKNGGLTVGTATYDAVTDKLTVTSIGEDISSAVQLDLFADVLPSTQTTTFTARLRSVSNPPDNSLSTVDQGLVSAFAVIANTFTATKLEANFTAVAGSSTGAVGGTANQKILSVSALSNGTQTLQKLVFDFNVDVTNIVNTANLLLKNGGVTVGTASYNAGTRQLTVSGIAQAIGSAAQLDLFADVLASSQTSSFTVSLSNASNPETNSASTVNQGYVKTFTTISNNFTATKLEADFASAAGAASSSVGGNNDVKILSFSAVSNGSQTLQKLIFEFNTNVSLILTGFELKNGGSTVGTATYSAVTNRLTVSTIGTSINTSVPLDLYADVLPTAVSGSFTTSLSNTFNPADNSQSTVNQGYVKSFTTVSNTVSIAALTATLTEITASPVLATTTLAAGTSGHVLTGFSVTSNGTQVLSAINFDLGGLASQFTTIDLYRSTVAGSVGSALLTGDADGNFSMAAVAAGNKTVSGTPVYYYLVVNTATNVTTLTADVTVTPTEADITFATGAKNTMSISRTFEFTPSAASTIAFQSGTTANIDYTAYQTASNLTQAGSENLGAFRIRDGGAANDPDALPTILDDVELTIGNWENVRTIAIFDGATRVAEASVTGPVVTLNNLNLTTSADDGTVKTKDFTVRGTFQAVVDDEEPIQITISDAVSDPAGSDFSPTGLATAMTGATANDIEVVATKLTFTTIPLSAVAVNATWSVTVSALDAMDNRDRGVDAETVVLSKTGGNASSVFTPAGLVDPNSVTLTDGQYNWPNLNINLAGTYNLAAADGGGGLTLTNAAGSVTVASLGVTVTPATPLNLCYGGDFQNLSNIVITETDPGDFSTSGFFFLQLPGGFIFDTSVTTAPGETGNEVGSISNLSYIGQDIVRFSYTVSGTTNSTLDALTISGLRVRYPGTTPTSGNIEVIDGGAVQVNNAESNAKNHGTLTAAASGTSVSFIVSEFTGNPDIGDTETRFSINTEGVKLIGTPAGGTFTGNGVSYSATEGTYIFTPASVGVGSYVITYTTAEASAPFCTLTTSKTFDVYSTVIANLNVEYCNNAAPSGTLSIPQTQIDAAMSWTGDQAGDWQFYDFVYYNADIGNYISMGTTVFDPKASQYQTSILFYGGVYIYYQVRNVDGTSPYFNQIYYAEGQYVRVNTAPAVSFIIQNQPSAFCSNQTAFTLVGSPSPANLSDVFAGNGVTNPSGSIWEFTPEDVTSLGTPFSISYTYTDPYTNCSNSTSQTVTVYPQPTAVDETLISVNSVATTAAQTPTSVACQNGSVFPFDATPVGGTTYNWYSNAGLTTLVWQGDTFNPPVNSSILGTTSMYVAQSINGCQSPGKQINITINPPVTVDAGSDVSICSNGRVNLGTVGASFGGSATTAFWDAVSFGSTGQFLDAGLNPLSPPYNFATTAFYEPSADDKANGFVYLLLTTNDPAGPCFAQQDFIFVTIYPEVVVAPMVNTDVCATSIPFVTGSIAGGTSAGTWSSNSSQGGAFGNAVDLNTFYIPGAAELTTLTNITITLTSQDPAGPCPADAESFTLSIYPSPVVDAGDDLTICEGSNVTLSDLGPGISGGSTTGAWALAAGGGGDFRDLSDNPSAVFGTARTFVPTASDVSAGGVVLRLTSSDPAGPCMAISDDVLISINRAAVVTPMSNQDLCAGTTVGISGSFTGGATSATWTTNGGGTFSPNNTTLNATYVPSAAELLATSNINITLTTNDPAGPCPADAESFTVKINPKPIVDAGSATAICEGNALTLSTLTASSTLENVAFGATWSLAAGGSGDFRDISDNADNVFATARTFHHAVADVSTTVVLRLTSNDPAGPCVAVSDDVNVSVNPAAVAAPLSDQNICAGTPVVFTGSIGGGATSATWSTDGDGSFTSTTNLISQYLPDANELAETSNITITLTTNDPAGPCPAASTTFDVTINPKPVVNAGTAATICEGNPLTLSALGASSTLEGTPFAATWSVAAGGSEDFQDLSGNPEFTLGTATSFHPSAAQIFDRSVVLRLTTSDPATPCAAEFDDVVLTINPRAIASAGADLVYCSGNDMKIDGTALGSATSITWSTNGGGTFDNASLADPTYLPSSTELALGALSINLTATTNDPDGTGPCVPATDVAVLRINPRATISAGADIVQCENKTITLAGALPANSVTSSYTWSGGLGTFVPDANTLNAEYVEDPTEVNTQVILTLTSNDPDAGEPCAAESDVVAITINRQATVTAGTDIEVCAGEAITLDGRLGGSASSVEWSETASGSLNNYFIEDPSYQAADAELTLGSTVTMTITTDDPTGPCDAATDQMTITIQQRPFVNAGPDFEVCSDQPVIMQGSIPANSAASTVTWSGGLGDFVDPSLTTTRYNNHPTEINATTSVLLTVTSNDPPGACPAFQDQVRVLIKPDPTAPTAVPPAPICVGQAVQNLTVSGAQDAIFRWYADEALTDFRAPGSSYATGISNTSDKIVHYWVTQTVNGCESAPMIDSLVINPNPVAAFSAANFCEGDFMAMTNQSSVTYTNGLSGTVNAWSWDFGDDDPLDYTDVISGDNRGSHENPEHLFDNIGIKTITLTARTTDGCVNSITQQYEVGPVPVAEFTFEKICESDATDFTAAATVGSNLQHIWTYDGTTENTGAAGSTSNVFPAVGDYDVELKIVTGLGCMDSITHTVSILPLIGTFPYTQSFEDDTHGWFAEGLVSGTELKTSWQVDAPNDDFAAVINNAADGSRVWITNANFTGATYGGSYYNDERSVLNTPCFNMDLDRPVVAFKYWNNTDQPNDGVYVEYFDEADDRWERLGELGSGAQWYNATGVVGLSLKYDIGQDVTQAGWSGDTKQSPAGDGWREAKFNMKDFKDMQKLRLRFVLGTNGDNPNKVLNGFAIDDFHVESRNRVILAENFTNLSPAVIENATPNNVRFRQFASGYSDEMVMLQYHTTLGGNDEIALVNEVDPNARAAYYGVTSAIRGFLDGKSDGPFADRNNPAFPWVQQEYDERSLVTSPISIEIHTPVVDEDQQFAVSATISLIHDLDAEKQYMVHVALVEKDVATEQHVLRKLLPSPAGQPLNVFQQGDEMVINERTDLAQFTDKSKVGLIVFVQELQTKSVLQTALLSNIAEPDVVTGVDGGERGLTVFPNPADHEFTLQLERPVTERSRLQLFDQMGKEVSASWFEKGDSRKTITTSSFAAGVYLIQMDTPEGIIRKKVMVLHSN